MHMYMFISSDMYTIKQKEKLRINNEKLGLNHCKIGKQFNVFRIIHKII